MGTEQFKPQSKETASSYKFIIEIQPLKQNVNFSRNNSLFLHFKSTSYKSSLTLKTTITTKSDLPKGENWVDNCFLQDLSGYSPN